MSKVEGGVRLTSPTPIPPPPSRLLETIFSRRLLGLTIFIVRVRGQPVAKGAKEHPPGALGFYSLAFFRRGIE